MKKLTKKELVWVADGVSVEEIEFNTVGSFKGSLFFISPNCISPLDVHAVKESWTVLNGKGELTINGKVIAEHIQAGDVIYFEPFESHTVKNTSDEVLKIVSLWWD